MPRRSFWLLHTTWTFSASQDRRRPARKLCVAADSMKKLSLELGGKSCCLVFEDADVASVAPRIAAAATIISGQQCHRGTPRTGPCGAAYCHERSPDKRAFLAQRGIRTGSRGADRSSYRSMLARSSGSTHRGSVRFGRRGLTCSHDSRRQSGERRLPHSCAGPARGRQRVLLPRGNLRPICVLGSFATEAEAVAKANNSVFGLSASVWTKDGARAMRIARALRDGTVWINEHNKLMPEAETGGCRHSGLGRLHGYDALEDFTELKHIYQAPGALSLTS
jgi:hypothetical protein